MTSENKSRVCGVGVERVLLQRVQVRAVLCRGTGRCIRGWVEERERERERASERARERERERERERGKDKEREKEREREKGKERVEDGTGREGGR